MKRWLLLTGALCALPTCLLAQEPGPDEAPDVEEVVVTAERAERPLYRTAPALTVIDTETLERRQTVTVADAVAQTPGVGVNRNGGPGGVTSVRIRGAEADQTVVLIDGVKLNDPASVGGGFDFAELLTGDVERIEVLRGPQSVLWGSQAIGGVVNVLSERPEGRLRGRLTAEGGSRGSAYVRAAVSAVAGRVSWRAHAGAFETAGVSNFNEERGGREADGYQNVHVGGRLEVKLTEGAALDLRATSISSRTEFDGFPPPMFSLADTQEYGEVEAFVGYAGLTYEALQGRWASRLGYARTELERTNFDPPSSFAPMSFESRGRNERLEYQSAFDVSDRLRANFGLESERSGLRVSSAFSPAPLEREVRLDSAYGLVTAEAAPGVTLSAGLRRDEHETFGGATVAQAGAVWALSPATRLRANWGQGFKAPSLYQLFSEYGNALLRPERANGWDVGVERRFGAASLTATFFGRRAEEQIDFFSCSGVVDSRCTARPFGFYANVRETEARGLEAAGEAQLGAWTVAGAYTWLQARNRSAGDPNRGRTLARRPEHAFFVAADHFWRNGLSTGGSLQYVGGRFDDAANAFQLEAYTLLDARASYPITPWAEVYGRIENLLDERYESTRLYGSPGRGVFAGVRASF